MEPCSSSALQDADISTFVFMDFESTSLLDRKCRITELCMLAVNREDMKTAGNFPRVTNKLTLCLNPRQPISMTSSTMTGLFNDSLENQKALTESTIVLINAFLNHLSKPICLLAHNGNRFDFPLLVAELKRINQSLDSSLLCADTLEAFRSLDGLPAKYIPTPNQSSVKKFQNSPNHCDNTSKAANTNTPLKRKGPYDNNTPGDQSPKISKLENSDKEKVKKKLFEDKNSDDEHLTNQDNKITEQNEETCEEFSSSLDDTDYLLALDSVEKELCQETRVLNNASKNVSPKSSNIKKKNETEEITKSPLQVRTVQETSVDPCVIANGTGYYVRKSTQEVLAEEKNTSEKRDETKDNVTTSSIQNNEKANKDIQYENDEKLNKEMTSRTLKLNHSNESEPTSNSKVHMSSKETNFVVTMKANQYSPIPKKISDSSSRVDGQRENKNMPSSSSVTCAVSLSNTKLDTGTDKQQDSPYVQRQSYKLEEIYLRKFGSRPPQSHRAEDDCITMAKIAKCSPGFFEWVDKNAVLLSNIEIPF